MEKVGGEGGGEGRKDGWKLEGGCRVSVRFVRKSPFIPSICRPTETRMIGLTVVFVSGTSNKEHQNDSLNNMSFNPRFFSWEMV